ncbi:uncharacterized protein LOC133908005 [Phragmites australis]|uniref:uncharacterized protein LOC133908005 n=1 Tax=Phragmites australis TaxID=29695 RepID=UPI002D7A0781|nr:uncharacterized protein LOC133908005 [Phragmites australis]
MRDWSSLEKGLLRDIFLRLPADADTVRFRHVCRGWHAAACADALVPRPWFSLYPSAYNPAPIASAFLRLARHSQCTRVRPVRMDAAVKGERAPALARGASRGWLAVNDGKRLLLRDPVSCAEVPLPAFDPLYELFGVFLSDDPLAAPGRWSAFGFFKRTDFPYFGHVLAFCRPGDEEWARFDQDDDQAGQQTRFFLGLEFFRGKAYLLFDDSKIAICDVDARRLVVSSVTMGHSRGWHAQERLVECGGDLLFVQVAWSYEITRSSWCLRLSYDSSFDVRVVKIELNADGSGAPVAWSDVDGIGDYALFVAPQSHAFALPASGFPTVRAGCVYHFNTYEERRSSTMIITDLRQRPHLHETVRKLPVPVQWHPLSWFCPRRPVFDTTSKRR